MGCDPRIATSWSPLRRHSTATALPFPGATGPSAAVNLYRAAMRQPEGSNSQSVFNTPAHPRTLHRLRDLVSVSRLHSPNRQAVHRADDRRAASDAWARGRCEALPPPPAFRRGFFLAHCAESQLHGPGFETYGRDVDGLRADVGTDQRQSTAGGEDPSKSGSSTNKAIVESDGPQAKRMLVFSSISRIVPVTQPGKRETAPNWMAAYAADVASAGSAEIASSGCCCRPRHGSDVNSSDARGCKAGVGMETGLVVSAGWRATGGQVLRREW